jgi:NAD-dependent deacetylase
MTTTREQAVQQVCELLIQSKRAVAFTGAGISTPSGIPDFRSKGTGLWEKDDPMLVASLSAFKYRPEVFFNWLRPLAATMGTAQPNPAHIALAELENAGRIQAVITQNIDGLHHAAGSKNVIEVHGTARTLSCFRCQKSYSAKDFTQEFIQDNKIPRCPACDTILKPDIVLFEEILPADAWSKAEFYCARADLILVFGSSLEVTPANSLPFIAVENGARLVINNLTPTYLDQHADVLLPYDVVEVIPQISSKFQ